MTVANVLRLENYDDDGSRPTATTKTRLVRLDGSKRFRSQNINLPQRGGPFELASRRPAGGRQPCDGEHETRGNKLRAAGSRRRTFYRELQTQTTRRVERRRGIKTQAGRPVAARSPRWSAQAATLYTGALIWNEKTAAATATTMRYHCAPGLILSGARFRQNVDASVSTVARTSRAESGRLRNVARPAPSAQQQPHRQFAMI
jgi:hypothetical protein